jgi:hypothetical protein
MGSVCKLCYSGLYEVVKVAWDSTVCHGQQKNGSHCTTDKEGTSLQRKHNIVHDLTAESLNHWGLGSSWLQLDRSNTEGLDVKGWHRGCKGDLGQNYLIQHKFHVTGHDYITYRGCTSWWGHGPVQTASGVLNPKNLLSVYGEVYLVDLSHTDNRSNSW